MKIEIHWPRTSKIIRFLRYPTYKSFLDRIIKKYIKIILWDDMKKTKIFFRQI